MLTVVDVRFYVTATVEGVSFCEYSHSFVVVLVVNLDDLR